MSILPALIFACSAATSGAEQARVPEHPVVADTPARAATIRVVWESPAPVGARRPAMSVAFSPDGRDLAASVGEEFIVWRSQDGSGRRVIREPATALAASVAFSPDGGRPGLRGRQAPGSNLAPLADERWPSLEGIQSRQAGCNYGRLRPE
jgi:hypothetical protein